MVHPNDGPSYTVVSEVRWDCAKDRLPEVVTVLEGAFRSAPEDKIAAALFRLRMLTRAREQRTEEMMEAEAVIWIEQLRTYPGDIVLEVLKTWTSRPNGQWWPTWHEVESELKRRCDRRQALLNFARQLAERPADVRAITDQPPTLEQRKAAVERYEREIRPKLQAADPESQPLDMSEDAVKRRANEALERLTASKNNPVSIGGELAKKLELMKAGE